MELFGALFSPFVRKVAVVAAEKGLALDMPPFSFAEPGEDFLAASPFRKIPAIKDGDYLLCDSTAICAYFDALAPEAPIYPAEARARGRAVWFEELADTIMVPALGPAIFNRFVLPQMRGVAGDEEVALAAIRKFNDVLTYLEGVIPAEGWLAGEFSLGDIAVASLLATAEYIDAELDRARFPAIAAWYDRVTARPAWQSVAAMETAHAKAAGLA
ncbi:glutathione S-transferase family protein [Novosphingobium sp. KACC 22771]|uniref:glutathione S-transferase family protein n=1 Tax=Novosphingobium sp. KACC 22771 TaxID=3025670 RepID=UPI00236657A2|nr:glutathione S-transferase family protein [Novosphingobium sp. KACC 22771]WDF71309.1 glutathione S-transferase family protein [Novosphingobium sp. KACC 22771]